MFQDKFNFFMDITNTKNSELASAVPLDASHISRIRKGTRGMPRKREVIEALSGYFSTAIFEDYQVKAVIEKLGVFEWPKSLNARSSIIYKYLSTESSTKATVKSIVSTLTSTVESNINLEPYKPEEFDQETYYYGNDGMREAAIRFLNEIIECEESQDLYLFSEESLNWMLEIPEFTAHWAELLKQVLLKGNKIKIIHNLSRNKIEIFAAINNWLPIYLTGLIEPYYFPVEKLEAFKRTLFIAPKCCAVFSNSLNNNKTSLLYIYVKDSKAIEALTFDFEAHLKICQPLITIHTSDEIYGFYNEIVSFDDACAKTIFLVNSLTVASMPDEVLISISKRLNRPKLLSLGQSGRRELERIASEAEYIELVKLPTMTAFKNDTIRLPLAISGKNEELYYTKEEFIMHLKYIMELNKRLKGYKVRISTEKDKNMIVFAREEAGSVLCRVEEPITFFSFREQHLSNAFWEYLEAENEKSRNAIVAFNKFL